MLAAVTRFPRQLTVTTMPLSTPAVGSISTTSATHWQRIADTALDLQRQANEVCWEMYLFHRHQTNFRATYKSAREIWNRAGIIHELLHQGSDSVGQIQKHVGDLIRLFHAMADDVSNWSATAIGLNLQSGHARLMRRGGSLKTLHAKLRALEELLQGLTEDTTLLDGVRENLPMIE